MQTPPNLKPAASSLPVLPRPTLYLHRFRQVWTYRGRVAFVLSITEKGLPVVDGIKLQRLRQLVLGIMTRRPGPSDSNGALAAMGGGGLGPGSAGVIVNIRKVRRLPGTC